MCVADEMWRSARPGEQVIFSLVSFAFTPLEIFLSATPNYSDVGQGSPRALT